MDSRPTPCPAGFQFSLTSFVFFRDTSFGGAVAVVVLVVRHGFSSVAALLFLLVQRLCTRCVRSSTTAGASNFLIRTGRPGAPNVEFGGSRFAPSKQFDCSPDASKFNRGVQIVHARNSNQPWLAADRVPSHSY